MSARYYVNPRPEMAAFLPKIHQRILEIGCGAGSFTENLNPEGEIWGVEPVRAQAEIAESKMDRVLIGTYDQVADDLPRQYFDLIVCNDVMEHMADHDAFLVSIKAKLVSAGIVVGSVPNVRFYKNLKQLLFKKDWRYTGKGILDQTHLRFFTQKSLERSLRAAGFHIEELSGINSILDEPFRANDLLKRTLLMMIFILTWGAYRDIQFLQFGFRVRKVARLSEPQQSFCGS